MALTIDTAGLSSVGKFTIFNTLTRVSVLVANYLLATIEPNMGVVPLPNKRLGVLAKVFNSQKIVPATVFLVNVTGIVKGASKSEGLGSQFLANICEANAICQVTRAFTDPDMVHVEGKIDPTSDIEVIFTELVLADLQVLEKAIPRLRKEVSGKKIPKKVLVAAEQCEKILNSGHTLFSAITTGELDRELVREFQLMASKPFICVLNMGAKGLADQAKCEELAALIAPTEAVFLDGTLKAELVELDEAGTHEMLTDAGLQKSGLDQLTRVGFVTLGLQTFPTAGEKESHAWTIHRGWTAPQTAGMIHTDFERGFIKADVISYDDLVKTSDLHKARELGKIRQEGKDYTMQGGDMVEFKFNV